VNEGLWIPIAAFTAITIIVTVRFWLRYRTRGDMQATIRSAIEKGQDLSPEIIDRLGNPLPPKDKDLRLALVWLALAIALVIFGFMIPDDEEEVEQIFIGIAAFPFFMGLAFLAMWRLAESRS